jgi:hypothetical protein
MTSSDRPLIEDALRMVLSTAPPGWTQLVTEFEPAATPLVARASAVCGAQTVLLRVPDEAVALVAEYQRRAAATGSSWRRIVIAVDEAKNIQLRTDPAEAGRPDVKPAPSLISRPGRQATPPSASSERTPRRTRIPLWALALAAAACLGLLAVAIVGAGEQATLRPMAASESMSDEQARGVAVNTARVWLRERDAGHVANFEALTCRGQLLGDLEHAKRHDSMNQVIDATGSFTRDGSAWKLDTSFTNGNDVTWKFEIVDGGLRVCGFETPTGLF